ncbi:hypothetical protein [Nocardia abscessus]|uniref:hypothetical protein n=1 Tax=Nocardia abscessus TaxID=120957 RepID=UPI0024573498|nr:hypothetical protein [Nocardia abscessus]
MGDAINPDYYKSGWSNGVELIDITENLTGNGAQAVQYVARSTRLDGVTKDDPIEDLTKAIWFIEREIQRLGGRTNDPGEEAYKEFYDLILTDQVNPDPKPREWDSIFRVPTEVVVYDRDRNKWRWHHETLEIHLSGGWEAWVPSNEVANDYGPFTEIKEPF